MAIRFRTDGTSFPTACRASSRRGGHLLHCGQEPSSPKRRQTMELTSNAILTASTPDYEAVKARQRITWATGDYGRIGVTLQIVGEELCESVRVSAADRVLDVAAGTGNASLAAARRFADVTSTDYVPELLEQGRRRAEADGLPMLTQIADAEDLPFADASFDVVLST